MYVAKLNNLYLKVFELGKPTSFLVTSIANEAYIFDETDEKEELIKDGFKFYKLNEVEVNE